MRVVCALLLIAAGSAPLAASDFEVATSNVASYPVKSKLSKGTRINVPDGGEITFIDRTAGGFATQKCSGQYKGPVEKCKPKPIGGGSDEKTVSGAPRAPRKSVAPQQ